MEFLIQHLLKELDDAETYAEKSAECEDMECKSCYRQLAAEELSHFERLSSLYHKVHKKTGTSTTDDMWVKYLKTRCEHIRSKINEI